MCVCHSKLGVVLCQQAAAYPLTPQLWGMQETFEGSSPTCGDNDAAADPGGAGQARELLRHPSASNRERGGGVYRRSGRHKSAQRCDLCDLKLFIWAETCRHRPTLWAEAANVRVGWLMLVTKLNMNPNEEQKRQNIQSESEHFFTVTEFNCEPSGHRTTSQLMKVQNDSETLKVFHPIWSLSDLWTSLSLHSPAVADKPLFFCFYWQPEAVWTQTDGSSGEFSEYKASGRHVCFHQGSFHATGLYNETKCCVLLHATQEKKLLCLYRVWGWAVKHEVCL